MRAGERRRIRWTSWSSSRLLAVLALAACERDVPDTRSYFDREIQPILSARCTNAGGGVCHVPDDLGRAMGNLDLSSYESVTRRPDVLRRFGPYPYPLLLMKAAGLAGNFTARVGDGVGSVPLFIRHAGGTLMTPDGDAYTKLARWLENGATRDGQPPAPVTVERGPCATGVRTDLFSQATLDAVDMASPEFEQFEAEVWPVLRDGCIGRVCHGVRDTNLVPTLELYLTCGDDEPQRRFNYLMARTFANDGDNAPLALKPLVGGSFHAGGKQFASVADPRYQALRRWMDADPPLALDASEGRTFFEHNVQPVLVARGCYLEACHSLVNFNFYKPLAGTDGYFGTRAQLHNYLQARFMLGLESEDPAQGRLLKKNLAASLGGIVHRGGPLLEPVGACTVDPAAVRADPTRHWFEELTAGCVVATWHRLERLLAVETGQLDAAPGAVAVFVTRPANPDRLIDFATYRPGADLLAMDLARDASGRVTGPGGAPRSLLGGCGVTVPAADVRRPDVSGDGTQVIFAMRASAGEGLDLWRVNIDGSGCQRLGLAGGSDAAGEPIHHFDPVFAPGGIIVFASTRGDPSHPDAATRGYPSRTPRWFLPNSNVWLFAPGGEPQRLSYLTGAELAPQLLHTREVVYAVEKAAPGFYQISTRAIRLDDGGGYRPQLGQRPTMGFGQVTEMKELMDFRTVYIASDPGAWFAGGRLSVQDLTLGLEELSFTGAGFFHPTLELDPGAAARPGEPGTGLYRSPTPLPDGRILVAYSPGTVDVGDPGAAVDYGLWIVDPSGRDAPVLLHDTPGAFDVEPAVAYRRIYVPQPNRVHQGDPLRGEVVFHSIPLFAFLLNDNSRVGTVPDESVARVRVIEPVPPPAGVTSPADVPAADLHGPDQVWARWRVVGEAPVLADGSLRVLLPARTPLMLQLLDAQGNVIDWQREEEQVGAGETQPRLISLGQFNAVCGGCHNALDGSELGVAVGPDVVTAASTTSVASQASTVAVDLAGDPAARPPVPVP